MEASSFVPRCTICAFCNWNSEVRREGKGGGFQGYTFSCFSGHPDIMQWNGSLWGSLGGVAEQERRVGVMHKEMAPNVVIRIVSGRSCVADAQLS